MNKVSEVKKHLLREHWISIIKSCQSSGMSIAKWCEANNVSLTSYYRNLRKFRQEACDYIEANKQDSVVFQKVEVESASSKMQSPILIHYGRMIIEVNDGAKQETLQTVLQALQKIC